MCKSEVLLFEAPENLQANKVNKRKICESKKSALDVALD